MTYQSPVELNMSKGLMELITYTNDVTDQWFSNLVMLGIFIIVLIGYYKARDDFAGALAVAGFGTFVVGLLFWLGGFVSGWTLSIAIGVLLLGVIVLMVDAKGS